MQAISDISKNRPNLAERAISYKCPEEADDGRQYYDGNGNHVYYDRRLIARPEKEKEEELQENNH